MRAVIQRVRRAAVRVREGNAHSFAREENTPASAAILGAQGGSAAGAVDPALNPGTPIAGMAAANFVTTGAIGPGVVVLLGISKEDTPETAAYIAGKTAQLRIFEDAQGRMNLSLLEKLYPALVISQFTLYGDVRHGRRPGFDRAASAAHAGPLYDEFVQCLRALGVQVETGVFQAHMEVELVNDGPVTILVDSEKKF